MRAVGDLQSTVLLTQSMYLQKLHEPEPEPPCRIIADRYSFAGLRGMMLMMTKTGSYRGRAEAGGSIIGLIWLWVFCG